MKQQICKFIYYKIFGWKAELSFPHYDKCIFCVAPHTSNIDLFIGKVLIGTLGMETGFLMKKEWFFFMVICSAGWVACLCTEASVHRW